MTKKTTLEKEKELLDKIEKAKLDLAKLQRKQKIEIGTLACKHGLNEFDTKTLNSAFEKLSGELQRANP